MKWLVTGGCGFLGVNLVRLLQKEGGHQIRIYDNLSVGSREDLGRVCCFEDWEEGQNCEDEEGVVLFEGDILNEAFLEEACREVDVIVHLAANTGVGPSVDDPRADCVANVMGVLNALEAARHGKVARFVFASSGAPVGEVEPPIHEEKVPRPVSPYGASKLAGEGYCSAYARTFGVETVALRFGNVYGPYSGKKGSVVAKFIRDAFDGKPLEVFGDGAQTRDFIFVEDLVWAIRQAAELEGVGGEIFQIASSKESSLLELLESLLPLLEEKGSKPEVVFGEKRVGDVQRNFSDTTKARERLQWRPETELKDGLRKTVDWFAAKC